MTLSPTASRSAHHHIHTFRPFRSLHNLTHHFHFPFTMSSQSRKMSIDRVNSFPSSLESAKSSFIGSTLAKLRESRQSKREQEILKTNYAKRPLTLRNVENLTEAHRVEHATNPQRFAPEVQISDWLDLIVGESDPNAPEASDHRH